MGLSWFLPRLRLLAEVAGLPDAYAVPLSLVAAVVLALVAALVAVYRELRAERVGHVAYVEAQLQLSRLREQAQDERNEKQQETIAKLTAVAELLSTQAKDPRTRGSSGNIR